MSYAYRGLTEYARLEEGNDVSVERRRRLGRIMFGVLLEKPEIVVNAPKGFHVHFFVTF